MKVVSGGWGGRGGGGDRDGAGGWQVNWLLPLECKFTLQVYRRVDAQTGEMSYLVMKEATELCVASSDLAVGCWRKTEVCIIQVSTVIALIVWPRQTDRVIVARCTRTRPPCTSRSCMPVISERQTEKVEMQKVRGVLYGLFLSRR